MLLVFKFNQIRVFEKYFNQFYFQFPLVNLRHFITNEHSIN